MNQILTTNMQGKKDKKNKSKSQKPAELKNIIKVFAISLMVFGVFMIGTGSYALYKGSTEKIAVPLKPTISVENKEDDTILLKVMAQNQISEVTYQWNDEEITTLNGNGGKYLEQAVKIPTGSNKLTIKAIDSEGGENSFTNIYELDSKIKLEALDNGNIKIMYEGNTEISYMTYRWDDGDETRVDINNTTIEQEIEAIKGNHNLTVIVVDISNKTEKKVQEIVGVSKPTVDVTTDETKENFVVKATDDTGLTEILFTINEDPNQQYKVRAEGKKKFEFKYPLAAGENKIKVQAYNQDGIMTEKRVLFRK